jgi:RimJ/RimL family protein N-acetyltransferase
MKTSRGPAYRIETPRLVIRCWSPADAPLLQEAVSASVDHLRPWMPWVKDEPLTIDERVELLRRFRGEFDLGHDFIYGIFDREETRVLGGTGLHTRRGRDVREIGYWIHASFIRRGLATENTKALVRVAFEIERVSRVEIRCDPNNVASSSIPRKLGFTRKGVLEGDPEFPGANRDTEIWNLRGEAYPGSPSYGVEVVAMDALERVIPF